MKLGAIVLMAFMLLGNISSNAQAYIGFKGGYNAGITSAAKSVTNIIPIKTLHGVTGGLVTGYSFNEYFDLQGELNITQKGFVINESMGFDIFNFPMDIGVDYKNRFTYIEVPLLAKGKIGNEFVKAYAAIGPQFGYLAKGRSKANVNVIIPITVFDRNLNLSNLGFERFEVSGVAALGVEFNLAGRANLFVEGRYTHGFTDYYKLPEIGGLALDTDIRNQSIAATVGVTFPIGNRMNNRTNSTNYRF